MYRHLYAPAYIYTQWARGVGDGGGDEMVRVVLVLVVDSGANVDGRGDGDVAGDVAVVGWGGSGEESFFFIIFGVNFSQ